MIEKNDAEAERHEAMMKKIAAIVAESMEGVDLVQVNEGVGTLLGAAYNLASLAGEDGKIAYVHFLRKHADTVEAAL